MLIRRIFAFCILLLLKHETKKQKQERESNKEKRNTINLCSVGAVQCKWCERMRDVVETQQIRMKNANFVKNRRKYKGASSAKQNARDSTSNCITKTKQNKKNVTLIRARVLRDLRLTSNVIICVSMQPDCIFPD